MSAHIEIPREEVEAFCGRWQIVELAFFGSVLRDDFGPDSDVDILVRFRPEARHTLFDMVTMQEELKQILGREADLVDRAAEQRACVCARRHRAVEGRVGDAGIVGPAARALSCTCLANQRQLRFARRLWARRLHLAPRQRRYPDL